MDWNAWLETEIPKQRSEIANGGGTEVRLDARSVYTMTDILAAAEEVTGIPAAAIAGRRRMAEVCAARRLAVKLAFKIWPGKGYEDMGRAFNRDRASVIHMMRHPEKVGFNKRLDSAEAAL